MKKVARELVSRMAQLTVTRAADQALANAQLNQPYIKRTILDLQNKAPSDKSASAIVIGAGPSLHRKGSIAQILNSGYKGTIVSADGALGHCLRSGLVPDYVVTLDPEIGWEKRTPKSDKIERRRCQYERCPSRKIH